MSKQIKMNYTPEYRAEAVKLVLEQGMTLREASERLDMRLPTLSSWVIAAREGRASGLVNQSSMRVQDQEAEIKRLRKELALAQMERDILKKATAYFAKDSLQSTRS